MDRSQKIEKQNIEDIMVLTPTQEGMLYHYLHNRNSEMYFEQLSLRMAGTICAEKVKDAWNFTAYSNEMLRTVFRWENLDKPYQIILKNHDVCFREYDFSCENGEDRQKHLNALKEKDRKENIDICTEPFRITFCKLGKNECEMILSFHHIILDGWSMGILLKEFFAAYESLCSNHSLDKTPKNKYKEFIKWQQKRDKARDLEYWKKYLSGFENKTLLPTEGAKGEGQYIRKEHVHLIPQNIYERLKEFAAKHHITPATILYAAFGVLLQRYGNEEDVVFGTTVSGRPPQIRGIENMTGLFINTIPLRVSLKSDETVVDFLKRIEAELRARNEFESTALVDIKGCSQFSSKENLFDSILVIENYPLDAGLKEMAGSLEVKDYSMFEMTNYDLNLGITFYEGIRLSFLYNGELMAHETIQPMACHYTNILIGMLDREEVCTHDIEMLSEDEKRQLVYTFNDTRVEYPAHKTLCQLCVEQAQKSPEKIAVVFGDKELTYQELDEKSNQLAWTLIKKGVKPDCPVGIIAERSLEMVIGIMGILKAGGAYIPIDPGYPEERIAYMLRDSNAGIVLTHSGCKGKIETPCEVLNLSDSSIYAPDTDSLEAVSGPDNLLYVIYTSGTTAKPKGVRIKNQSFVNLMNWFVHQFEISEKDRVLLIASMSFDLAQKNFFAPLITGGQLHLFSPGTYHYDAMSDVIERENITILNCTPSAFYPLLDTYKGRDNQNLKSLKHVFLGGEPIHTGKLKDWVNSPWFNCKIVNTYGPTECTDIASFYVLENEHIGKMKSVPIGRPVYNARLYVLDKNQHVLPVGVSGELCIGGEGVGEGYHNAPELTREKYISAYHLPDKIVYRTGDRVRWLSNGNIEFLGRMDNQVKIRGFRIELGEIETQLLTHPQIQEVVVTAVNGNSDREEQYLCAYIVADAELKPSDIRDYLAGKLPYYMIPSHCIRLDKFPVTANGKIDKRALPEPGSIAVKRHNYEAPANTVEEKMAQIWGEVLGLQRVGRSDNFYEIGGDSIKAIQVLSRQNKHGIKVEISDIFNYPCIKELAKHIKSVEKKKEADVIEGEVLLTPIQKWFLDQNLMDKHHFNQAVMLFGKDGFDESLLVKVFSEIVKHHDALRMVYRESERQLFQYNRGLEGELFSLKTVDLRGEPDYRERIEEESEKIQASIHLSEGPLMKLGLFKTSEGDCLLIAIHHLVIDGVSWRIILEDFAHSYRQVQKGQAVRLQQKTNSYLLWSKSIHEYAKSSQLLDEAEYWKKVSETSAKCIRKDGKVEKGTHKDTEVISFELDKEDTQKLLRGVNRAYNTEINDILLAALGCALKGYPGQDKVLIDLEGHGRENLFGDIDISRTVGWFTSIYPVILDTSHTGDMGTHIKTVKENLRAVPVKGIGYNILKYIANTAYIFDVQTEIGFNYLGQFNTGIENELFKASDIGTGAQVSPRARRQHGIEIIGMIYEDMLKITIDYNKNGYHEAEIIMLASRYKEGIEEIITHCTEKQTAELTPSDLSSKGIELRDLQEIYRKIKETGGGEIKDIYFLTPMQEGMLFYHQMDKKSNAYFEQGFLTIHGDVDVEKFEESFNIMVERHDVLRTIFVYEGMNKPVQAVLKRKEEKVTFLDISKEENKEELIDRIRQQDIEKGIHPGKDSLMRMMILKTGEKEYKFIWSFHHIIMDGWCLGIVAKELFKIYEHLKSGRDAVGSNLVEKELGEVYPYSSYIKWMEEKDKEESLRYWETYLEGYEQNVVLPGRRKEITPEGYDVCEFELMLDENITKELVKLAQENQVTLNTVIQAVWGIILRNYNNADDIVFGYVVSGRTPEVAGVENILGLFINTVPMRAKMSSSLKFNELLKELHGDALNKKKHEYISLAEIQNKSLLKQNLLNHIVVFENYPLEEAIGASGDGTGFKVEKFHFSEQTNYDFNMVVWPGREMKIKLTYNGLVYERDAIARTAGHIREVIKAVIEKPDTLVGQITMLSENEKTQILKTFNDTCAKYPQDKTIHQLFQEQVIKFPDRIVVIYEDTALTYQQLNDKANQVANYLTHTHGIKEDSLVGVFMERSENMLVALMGIFKAGCAYVPIDPEYPEERAKGIVDDSGIHVVISSRKFIEKLNRLQWQCEGFKTYLCLDAVDVYLEECVQKNELMDDKLWDYVGSSAQDDISGGGWVSSYTGNDFTREEMEEYADNILKKLQPYLKKDARVLEIGCASGISMFNIAPHVGFYYGIDISRSIIEKNKRKVEKLGIQNIQLDCLSAHQIHELGCQNFDIVIMNSVVHCFHGLNYLRDVISKAIKLLKYEGIIFIGDTLDQDLKTEFLRSLVEFKNTHHDCGYRTKTDYSSELFVSKKYFEDLKADFIQIKNTIFSRKYHTSENELTLFRYDAVLEIDKSSSEWENSSFKRNKHKYQHGLDELGKYPTVLTQNHGTPKSLAYVIYTSGSTGKPKGTMIEHYSVINRLHWMQKKYPLGTDDVILQKTPYTFDVSVWELLWPVITGTKLCFLIPGGEKDPAVIAKTIQKNKVTAMHFVPSMLDVFLDYIESKDKGEEVSSLRQVFASGEALNVRQVQSFHRILSQKYGIKLANLYGPTEATVDVSYFDCRAEESMDMVPIGKPIDNISLYVINKDVQLQPLDVPGELCIAGDGLARGYLNRPELTDEKFVPNPFKREQRMYKTGDLARWMQDGNIEFLGRMDYQVKIRGYRIELGEIEAVLLKHDAVKQALVTAMEDTSGDKYLCAYIVNAAALSVSEIRAYLAEQLSEYMIPSYFVFLEKLPLTPNGKVDRKALPHPTASINTGALYEAPENEIELSLVSIWKDILRIENIGVTDNFFELGGHSLKATSMISRVHKEHHVEVPVREVFKTPTIRQLAKYIKDANEDVYHAIKLAGKKEYYRVSSAQKRMYVLNRFESNGTSYNMSGARLMEGKLDKSCLEKAFGELVKRHEVLRTSFNLIDGNPVQWIQENATMDIELIKAEEAQVDTIIKGFIRPFDLTKAPLLRVGLIEISDERHILMLDMHHIISDGVSIGILTKEFQELYNGEKLTPLRIQYKDFSEWQNTLLDSEEMKKQEEYWLKEFEGEIPVLKMPPDFKRPTVQSLAGSRVKVKLSRETTCMLNRLVLKEDATLFMTLLAALNTLLHKYTGQDDIVVGTPIAGRHHADLENMIGMFINTLPIRNRPQGNKTFSQFLREVKESSLKAFENQDYQFEELVEKLDIRRDTGRNPLFDVAFVLQNTESSKAFINNLTISSYAFENNTAKFDLTLSAEETDETIELEFEYCTSLYKRETIERLAQHYINILEQIAEDLEIPIDRIDMLTEKEKQQLLYDFNNTNADYPRKKTIHCLFEEQVQRTPDHIAVVFEEKQLTYRELNQKANQLARVLRQNGVGKDTVVGIMMEHSLEMMIGILGILKAGGAYLPIDSGYPEERIRFMLEDSGIRILLTKGGSQKEVPFEGMMIDLEDETLYENKDGVNLEDISNPQSLAYIIYTSGTTGKPKGVMIEHYNVVRLFFNDRMQFDFRDDDVWTLFHSYCFDFSVWEMYGALLYGGKLIVIPRMVARDTGKYLEVLKKQGVTILNQTPTAFYSLVEEEMKSEDKSLLLRYVIFGGEALKPGMLKGWRKKYSCTKLINMYGITETTVHVTYKEITEKEIESNISNIGKPIPTLTTYIMDSNMNLQPIGVPGELCVGGEGLGRGYLNRPELTQEKFVPNPYKPGERIYKSGDLARITAKGEMEYYGRIDRQVKIRGHRIELGEIEMVLLKNEEVKEAVVAAKEDAGGDKYLCAYLVSSREFSVQELRGTLEKNLPHYMVPSYFIKVDKIPVTSNGKADIKALPEPEANIQTGAAYEAPRNEVEEKLTDIWSEVLGVQRVGIHDNFFDLGGHSLKATALIARINLEFGVELGLVEVFNCQTVASLTEVIMEWQRNIEEALRQIEGLSMFMKDSE